MFILSSGKIVKQQNLHFQVQQHFKVNRFELMPSEFEQQFPFSLTGFLTGYTNDSTNPMSHCTDSKNPKTSEGSPGIKEIKEQVPYTTYRAPLHICTTSWHNYYY